MDRLLAWVQLALQVFAYRVRKYIGACAAAMDGCDVIAFTGRMKRRCLPLIFSALAAFRPCLPRRVALAA